MVVVDPHWAANWGYDVDRAMTDFACRLIDGGVDLVHRALVAPTPVPCRSTTAS
ncbi:CapA family protein [Yinghuangia aomiensis]